MPFDNDGSITWELMVERMNSDLANILGNLVNRTISMNNKYFGGVISNPGVNEPVDDDLKAVALAMHEKWMPRWRNSEWQTRLLKYLHCSEDAIIYR
mgnify:CR=1 FL=1